MMKKLQLKILEPKYWKQNIKPKFWIRTSVLSFVLVLWLFIDEYIKTGYYFDPNDIYTLGTHESLIMVLLVYGILSLGIHRIKGGKHGEQNNN